MKARTTIEGADIIVVQAKAMRSDVPDGQRSSRRADEAFNPRSVESVALVREMTRFCAHYS
jgi:hypothetical protein